MNLYKTVNFTISFRLIDFTTKMKMLRHELNQLHNLLFNEETLEHGKSLKNNNAIVLPFSSFISRIYFTFEMIPPFFFWVEYFCGFGRIKNIIRNYLYSIDVLVVSCVCVELKVFSRYRFSEETKMLNPRMKFREII